MRTAADGVSKAELSPIRRVRCGVRGETNIEVLGSGRRLFADGGSSA